ncbi:helix-turn-helix transcriptional regulator [Lacticaseibacillus mingshuiensis]|uniref:Helix-turn-helix transcriptional regulator n=1 Tax=Lacticaseibacillus mingshuiensis TaxID=2799574 RepID=A0ABW4CLW1_9LACO|nr:YafY family protein [Lacticaseibacillus mingshuiensis]
MKIDRLIGVLAILLQRDGITAPELAERFEVSRRTINRDIDVLTQAGIPVYAKRGRGGGISIIDGYRIDRTLLTSRDMRGIMAGLRSLDSVSGSHYYERLMEKIQAGSTEFVSGRDYMLIDLSSWYRARLAPKITAIQDAIERHQRLQFNYASQTHEAIRTVAPYFLIFKWSNWYLWGFDTTQKDARLYKLNRIAQLTEVGEFVPQVVAEPSLDAERTENETIWFRALFNPAVKWRVVDEFSPDQLTTQFDGRLLLEGEYSDLDSLIQWLMSFQDQVTVIEPAAAREALVTAAKRIIQRYQ